MGFCGKFCAANDQMWKSKYYKKESKWKMCKKTMQCRNFERKENCDKRTSNKMWICNEKKIAIWHFIVALNLVRHTFQTSLPADSWEQNSNYLDERDKGGWVWPKEQRHTNNNKNSLHKTENRKQFRIWCNKYLRWPGVRAIWCLFRGFRLLRSRKLIGRILLCESSRQLCVCVCVFRLCCLVW